MGKQTNKIEYVDQAQFDKNLDESLEILINDGANDDDINFYIDDYKSRYAVKKKDGTKPNSTSTSASQKQDLVQKNGSSGTPQFEYKPIKDERGREVFEKDASGNLVPAKEKVLKGYASSTEERGIVREELKQKALKEVKPSVKYQDYKVATQPKQEEIDLLSQEVDAEINQQGFLNGLKTGAKKGVNFLADAFTAIGTLGTETDGPEVFDEQPFSKEYKEAEKQLLSEFEGEKSRVTPDAIKERTKKIVLDKKVTSLKVDKNNEFLSKLPESEKKALELERVSQYKTISDRDKYLATESSLLINELESLSKDYAIVKAIAEKAKKNGTELTPEFIEKSLELENNLTSKIDDYQKLEKEYSENTEEIGSAEEEVDFLKRNYSGYEKFKTNVKLGLGDLYVNVSKGLPILISDLDDMTLEKLRFGSGEGIMSEEERKVLIDEIIDWESAKSQTKDKYKRDVEFSSLNTGNIGQFIAQEVGTQIPIFAQMALPGGVVSIGVTSAADKYGQMEMESNQISFNFKGNEIQGYQKEDGSIVDGSGFSYNPDDVKITSFIKPDYSKSQMLATAVGFGTAEAVLGALPTKNALGRVVRSFENSNKRQLLRNGFKSFVTKPGKEAFKESWTEGATSVIQNFLDIKVLGKNDVGLFDNVDHAMFTGGLLGGMMGSVPAIAGLASRPFSNKTETKLVRKNLTEILALREQLNNPDISDAVRKATNDKINTLEVENNTVLTNIAERSKGLTKEAYEAIVSIDKKQELLRLQASEIKADKSIKDDFKQQLLNDLKVEFNMLEDKRSTLNTKEATILDTLSDSEKSKLRNEATEIIKSEHTGDGEAKIDDKQVTKKAIELYKKSNAVQQEATTTENKQETQPQAEVQETEQEAITKEDIEVRRKETESKIKRKDLFSDGGTFSNILGESGVDSVPTRHTETNGIEFVEFSNPNTGIVDVVMSGTSSNDFVGYYRIYENGKPTEKWSSKFENQSRNKENFKTMIGGVQSMLPKGHEYTEKTSISTDGLRVWEQQLSRGYEIQTDENGNIVTNEVAINGDAIVNELGIDVELGSFSDIEITKQQFESVKEKLLPYLKKLGLDSDNIRIQEKTIERTGRKYNTVVIDLPVLKSKTSESNNNQINNADNYLGTPTVTQTEDGDLYEFKTKDGIIAGVMVSPTEFRIDGISANEIGKGMGSKMFENLIDHLKNKGVDTITTKSAGEGAVKMHQKAVDKGLLTEVSKNGREATFNINKNESTQGENKIKSLFTGRKKEVKDFKYTKGEFIFFSENEDVAEKYGVVTRAYINIKNFFDLSSQDKKNELIESMTDDEILKIFKIKVSDRSRFPKPISEEIKIFRERVKDGSQRFSAQGELQNTLLRYLKSKGYDGVVLQDAQYGKLDNSYVVFNKNVINNNEATPTENNVSDGNSRIGIEPLAEVGKTTEQATENAPTKSISPTVDSKPIEGENEVEYTLNEINKGILEWSGDILSPRIDLGISWADIRKGEADIKRGKPSTVPAKRLIEAINKAKKEGGYRYKQGTGGPSMRSAQFVSFEDMQKATNEEGLTDAEINEINQKEYDLYNQYDEEFNSLDEESQNEILENYENKPREISENSEIGKSENDVSNEQKEEGAREEKVKEDSVLDRILNQDELKDTFDFLDSLKIDPKDLKATLPFLPNVWNTFIDGVKLSMKAGNTMRKAIIEAKNVLESQGFDKLEINKVLVAFQDKFLTEEEKAFIDGVLNDSSSEENSRKFSDMASKVPNTEEVGLYMSGDTYEKYMGVIPENNQEMFRMRLIDALKYGIDTIQVAVETFGDNFVDKVLDYIESNNISIESKSLLLISLENELERQKIADPANKDIQAKLNLVLAKRQAFASSVSKALNMNRLKAFAKAGFDKTEITDKMFSDTEKRAKRKVENAVESTFEDINNEDSSDEFDSDFVIAEPKNKRSKEDAKKDLNDALKALKEDWKNLNKGITLNATIPGYKQIEVATPHILKMAKAMVEIGGYNTKEIIETIYDNLKGTFNGVKKSDISNILKEDQTKSKPKKNQKMKNLVKEALISKGFFREVNVKQKDGTREVKKYLDWKKLAGKEGTLENIKKKTEEALKDLGYTDSQIEKMQDALIEELTDLRASIIEKSMNELDNRNRIKDNTERKNIAKKLSELYNFGLFEKDPDAYQNILNSAIGFNKFKEKQFEELTKLAESLSILFSFENGKNNNNKLSQLAIKTQTSIINQEVKAILNFAAFADGNKGFKLTYILREFAGLSQRAKLLSLKQFIENPFSGFVERKFQQVGEFFITKEDGRLVANRKKLSKHILNDIIQNGGSSYGDVTTVLTSETAIEGWLNKQSDNRLYHLMLTNLTGRSYLEAADSMNKALLTEKMFTQNLVKVLSSKGSPLGIMSKSEAMKYVADKITGQNFEDALKLAEEVIDKVNNESGKNILPKTKQNIYRFANDIVKESLSQGTKMDLELVEKSYNAAYKSAGFNLGHEANNVISRLVGAANSSTGIRLDRAIKQKKWNLAAIYNLESILVRNILNPFVGGGTNWVVLTAQKAGMDPISIFSDLANARDNKIDLTTEEGMKNLENALVRSTNLRNTSTRTLIGAVVSISMAAAYIASGKGDDLEDWLKKNEWSRKYFKVLSPTVIALMMSIENDEFSEFSADMASIKSDNFNQTLNLIKSFDNEKRSTLGELGRWTAQPFDTPLPWRFVKDVDNLQKGIRGIPEYKSDYRVTGFLNGFFQGGSFDYMGIRPDGDPKFDKKKKKKKSQIRF